MDVKENIKKILNDSIAIKKEFLADTNAIDAVAGTVQEIISCYKRGGKVLVFGNGGSAADSEHFAAELVVRFEKERRALACIALTADIAALTAISNDYDFNRVFSRQIEAIGKAGDLAIAISTSGKSENVIEAAKAAKAKKISVIAITGRDGGRLKTEADIAVIVKGNNTARIQEVQMTVIHAICKLVEDAFAE
ncbi:MAG: SIS domain-containing protein [Candidatus Omnitrophica bacterium]|nr:SIS domain-containing protein [Candidatus Omnitrophota bacterium]